MTSFLDKNGLQRYHNDIKEGLNEVAIQNNQPTDGKIWFDPDSTIIIDPSDFDVEKQEVVISNIPPEPDDHHKLWIQPIEGGKEEEFIVNTLTGDEPDKAPSVKLINSTLKNLDEETELKISAVDSKVIDLEDVVEKSNTYSTNEQIIGTWINGKPIYRKVVNIGVLPNNTTKTVNSGITTNIYITKLYGVAWSSNYDNYLTLPDVHPGGLAYSTRLYYTNSNRSINIYSTSDRSGFTGIVVLEYTK